MTPEDETVVRQCLRAAVEGPFFPDWEFQTLFGVTRDEMRSVLSAWPRDIRATQSAVTSAMGNLIGYPHGRLDAWSTFITATPDEVSRVLSRWLES